jgi:hypothetical protein
MSEPRTAAGRALLADATNGPMGTIRLKAILAIEAEAFSRGRSDSLPSGEWEEAHALGYREGHRAAKAEAAAPDSEALLLLREVARGWEPGPGPFTVPLPTVNRVVNLLAALTPEAKDE